MEVCQERASAKSISLVTHCDGDITGKVNPNLLEQAVVNLLDNAIKYSGEGSHVQAQAETSGKWLEISVKDDGQGIDSKHLDRLFERFYRVQKCFRSFFNLGAE